MYPPQRLIQQTATTIQQPYHMHQACTKILTVWSPLFRNHFTGIRVHLGIGRLGQTQRYYLLSLHAALSSLRTFYGSFGIVASLGEL